MKAAVARCDHIRHTRAEGSVRQDGPEPLFMGSEWEMSSSSGPGVRAGDSDILIGTKANPAGGSSENHMKAMAKCISGSGDDVIEIAQASYSGRYLDELSVGLACRYLPVVATEECPSVA